MVGIIFAVIICIGIYMITRKTSWISVLGITITSVFGIIFFSTSLVISITAWGNSTVFHETKVEKVIDWGIVKDSTQVVVTTESGTDVYLMESINLATGEDETLTKEKPVVSWGDWLPVEFNSSVERVTLTLTK